MNSYHVLWEIDIEAETPELAAREALRYLRDPRSTATVFDVTPENGDPNRIDLTELDEAATAAAGPWWVWRSKDDTKAVHHTAAAAVADVDTIISDLWDYSIRDRFDEPVELEFLRELAAREVQS